MPAIMIMPDSGVPDRVIGSNSDIAEIGPMPGSTPTSVPMKTPRKQYRMLIGSRATPKPCMTLEMTSILSSGQPISKMPEGNWIRSACFSTHHTPTGASTASGTASVQRTGSIARSNTSISGMVEIRKPSWSSAIA